ncbi:helix-turn-helix transcriptional regulator [Streptomyces caniferus]|uniref:helix-turn-helix transcriptional regulator n=1 Tax=Streptomyces caniferus TaxID=285557 RepID=UPI0033C287CE
MDSTARRKELAAFIRSRRERLSPHTAGLNPGPRRRTPGLRREEVAQLSGVSVTWYTWLEQARNIRVSRQVLDAVADTLQLTPQERRHLMALSGVPLLTERKPVPLNPLFQRLLDELSPKPAYVISPCWDLLAWNQAHAALIGDPLQWPVDERNLLWLLFTHREMRSLLVDWHEDTQRLIAQYRAAAARHAGDPRFEQLTQTLCQASSEFRQGWTQHDIGTFEPARKEFDHPALGRLTLEYTKLIPDENSDVIVVIYLPADAQTRAKLPLLGDPTLLWPTVAGSLDPAT